MLTASLEHIIISNFPAVNYYHHTPLAWFTWARFPKQNECQGWMSRITKYFVENAEDEFRRSAFSTVVWCTFILGFWYFLIVCFGNRTLLKRADLTVSIPSSLQLVDFPDARTSSTSNIFRECFIYHILIALISIWVRFHNNLFPCVDSFISHWFRMPNNGRQKWNWKWWLIAVSRSHPPLAQQQFMQWNSHAVDFSLFRHALLDGWNLEMLY